MPDIVIVGAGFAGVWASAAAARVRGDADLDIAVVAPTDTMVLRPRLYESDPTSAAVPLDRLVKPIGVRHVQAAVTAVDTENSHVVTDEGTLGYRKLVLATGSRVVRPDLPESASTFDVDTLDAAIRLADHLRRRPGYTVVVVGAGFVGLELATELAAHGRVVLVERADVVGPELGEGPRPVIESALHQLGIDTRLGTTVTGARDATVSLSDGTTVDADAVAWTAGMTASPLAAQVPGTRDALGRLRVDGQLRVTADVFAAGDVAAVDYDADHVALQCCQHATPMGKVAGHNAAADLLGRSARDFAPAPYVTCLDLGAAGAVFTRGWERRVVADGDEGKRVKRWLMNRIHPPVDDAAALLSLSDTVWLPVPDSVA